MKKLLSIGLLTVCALAYSERPAQAWVNAKFSVGLNWQLQSANNNFLWGVFKNGQVPGPEAFGGGVSTPFPYGAGPGPYLNPPGGFPYFGQNPQGAPQTVPTQTVSPPQASNQQQAYYGLPQNYYSPYQTVSYHQTGYYYPNYYVPTYQQYYYQAPSYWYQGR